MSLITRSGDGYGSGYGYGDGSGDGDGDGVTLATVAGHAVRWLAPWDVVAVGCQTHTVAEWRARWREIAGREGVDVDGAEVEQMFAAIEAAKETK